MSGLTVLFLSVIAWAEVIDMTFEQATIGASQGDLYSSIKASI